MGADVGLGPSAPFCSLSVVDGQGRPSLHLLSSLFSHFSCLHLFFVLASLACTIASLSTCHRSRFRLRFANIPGSSPLLKFLQRLLERRLRALSRSIPN